MLHLLLALMLPLPGTAVDTVPRSAVESRAPAYLDPDAHEMVRRVRERRLVVDGSISSYRVLARERMSVGMRAMRRDRVLFRRETAARVYWTREGTGRIEVLGARQVVPVALPEPRIPNRLRRSVLGLAFDPGKDRLLQGFGDDDFFRHPLAEGSEADYRFQAGDTTRLRLSPDRVLRLVELRVIPRRVDARLVRGSFWLDADTHAPVRATFQLARPVDLERDLGEDEEDIPAVFKPIVGDLRYLTIEYGLWEQRWWLPRLIALEVVAQAGSLANIPVTFERSYDDYRVTAVGDGAALLASVASDSLRRASENGRTLERCRRGTCSSYEVELPTDSMALLASEFLPPSIYAENERLMTEGELRAVAEVLGGAVPAGPVWQRPELRWSYLRPNLLRFNRVQGLAIGGRVDARLGLLAADATLWLETARAGLSGEVGATRSGFRGRQRLAVYRRLAAVEPDPRALGPGRSLSALLLGRDDADYYRALGVEALGHTVGAQGLDYGWRLFAERQEAAEKRTDFSLPHLLDRGRGFAPNIAADAADQVGGAVTIRVARGLDPRGLRWGAEAEVGAETGSYRLVRPSASAYAGFPLPRRLIGHLEVEGGTAVGDVPLQGHWIIGGPSTVRGFGGGSRIHGTTFWRGRAEVASAFPGARLVLFSDVGWAGERADLSLDPRLVSGGVGVSLLDGILRLDLARALRGGRSWRLDLHLDAPM